MSEFKAHGYYTVCNNLSYEVEISKSGDAARLRYPKGYVTKWMEIVYVYEKEEPEALAVIDPDGYNIPLNLVIKIDNN